MSAAKNDNRPFRRRASLPLVASLCLSLLVLSARAQAQQIVDAESGFRIVLSAPEARVCVLLPRGMDVADACAGLELAAVRAAVEQANPGPFGVAIAHYPDGSMVTISMMSMPHLSVRTKASLDELLSGAEDAARRQGGPSVTLRGDAPGARFDELRIEGVRVVRTGDDGRTASPPLASLFYLVLGSRSTVMLSFSSDADHAPQARALADRTIATVSLPSGAPAERSRQVTSWMSSVAIMLGGAALGVLTVWAWIAYQRAGARAAAPAGWPRIAARSSWMSVLIAVGGMIPAQAAGRPESTLVVSAFGAVLMVAGLFSGLYALAMLVKVGRAGILAPALIGVGLNAMFFASAAWALWR